MLKKCTEKKIIKEKRLTEHISRYILIKTANTFTVLAVFIKTAPPLTHLLLILPPRASRSAASRGPARAR